MSQILSIRLKDEVYNLLRTSAKASGKSLSSFASELITQAIKQDMKETTLLSKLLKKLESLSEPQPLNAQSLSAGLEQKLLAIFEVIVLFASYFFIDKTKLQSFMQDVERIKEKFFE